MNGGKIDLVLLGPSQPVREWRLGAVHHVEHEVSAVAAIIHSLASAGQTDAIMFFDPDCGIINQDVAVAALDQSVDIWHAGLVLGLADLPKMVNLIQPAWTFGRDPAPEVAATSWRLSFRAALIRTEVLRRLGGLRENFATLEGAALELGHRYISNGVFMRHLPNLITATRTAGAGHSAIPLEDEIAFGLHRYTPKWVYWALFRMCVLSEIRFAAAWRHAWSVRRRGITADRRTYEVQRHLRRSADAPQARVTVLIPTIDRYPYLETLLQQLGGQTVPPLEIIVVDQTPRSRRDTSIAMRFSSLPLTVIHLDEIGQCISRNTGLHATRGDCVLFIDDDDEVSPTLIEEHLNALDRFGADVSCGVAHEVGAGVLPSEFRFVRMSDVLPTNNAMVKRAALERSGLFDLAYNRGARADSDLGMRLYLSGAFSVLNPAIGVLHHHAPAGGLRTHRARVITYASSRQRVFHRRILSGTEIYLLQRYFAPAALREAMWHSILGTFSVRGGTLRRMAKACWAGVMLPVSLWQLRREWTKARGLFARYPEIPCLERSPRPVVK